MPRRARPQKPGDVCHVWARGVRQMPLFEDDEDRHTYLVRLGTEVGDRGWQALAYCLMGNHVHHLLRVPGDDLSSGIREVHRSYAVYLNRRHGRAGHAFQGRFGCSVPTDADGVLRVACYIALNPLRAGLCRDPADYRWSSHGPVLGSAAAPSWLDVDGLLARFGGRRRYRSFVAAAQLLGGVAALTSAAATAAGP